MEEEEDPVATSKRKGKARKRKSSGRPEEEEEHAASAEEAKKPGRSSTAAAAAAAQQDDDDAEEEEKEESKENGAQSEEEKEEEQEPAPAASAAAAAAVSSRAANPRLTNAVARPDDERRTPSKVRHIDLVQIGNYELKTWYYSPYPDPYRTAKKLFVCQYCLKYCAEIRSITTHMKECTVRRPPGKLIYQDGRNSVFEVDGSKHKLYCQCLALFSKLFIDHKTLYFDVDPFLFYVLTETPTAAAPSAAPSSPSSSSSSSSSQPHQIVGYFSKEKVSPDQFNVSCILTFPQYQRKGYGRFLIALSYELSRREKRLGSPEKPLSELGRLSYRSYWLGELLKLLAAAPANLKLSLVEICNTTAIKKEDVISALDSVGLIKHTGVEHALECSQKQLQALLTKFNIKVPSANAVTAATTTTAAPATTTANGRKNNNGAAAAASSSSAAAAAAASSSSSAAAAAAASSSSSSSGTLEFHPALLHWNPPPSTLSSPSVAFPATHSPVRKAAGSHSKKKIKY